MIENKNIVITGASSGIGLDVMKLLMKGKGNRILAVARKVAPIEDLGANVIPFSADVSSAEGVESIFAKAEEVFADGKVDIFYANAGFPYFEKFDYTNWDRVKKIFDTNTLSPIYTYARYLKHLNGRDGHLAYTISAMGKMAMPGYALYTASKFAMTGFQEAIRLEKPENLRITCLYPVATATNFFKVANKGGKEATRPFPVQKSTVVARKMVEGLEGGRDHISPCVLFDISKVLMGAIPSVKTFYWNMETKKFLKFINSEKGE